MGGTFVQVPVSASMSSSDTSTPPDGQDRAVVLCASVGGFANLYATQAVYPELHARFGLDVVGAGTLLTATTLTLALLAPWAGRLSARLGLRLALVGGLMLLAASSAAFGLVADTPALTGLRLLQGATIPVVLSALLAWMSQRWPAAQRSRVAADYVTGTIVGGLLGRFMPAALVSPLGWSGAFLAFSLAQWMLAAHVWRRLGGRILAAPETPPRPQAMGLRQTAKAWRGPVGAVALAGAGLLFTQTAVTTYLAVQLGGPDHGWSSQALGATYAVFLPALWMVRRTPSLIRHFGLHGTLRAAWLLCWAGLAATLTDQTFWMVAGLAAVAVSIFVGQAVLAQWLALVGGEHPEQSSGLYLCAYYLGGSAGAVLPAMTWEFAGWFGCVLWIAGVQWIGDRAAEALGRPPRPPAATPATAGHKEVTLVAPCPEPGHPSI